MKSSEKLSSITNRDQLYDLYVNQKLSCKKIGQMFNCSDHCISKYLNKWGIPARKFENDKGRPRVGKLFSCTWINIKSQSYSRRKIEFNIDEDYIVNLYEKQMGLCALSGIELYMPKTSFEERDGFRTASLDRIDSKKGYIEGNVQWVHKQINRMKWDLDDINFTLHCFYIADWNSKEKTLFKNIFNFQDSFPELYYSKSKNIQKIGYITKTVYLSLKNTKRQFNLSQEFINDLIISQKFKCALSGQGLCIPQSSREKKLFGRTASLDRIDSSRDYEENNVWFVHKDINTMKLDLTVKDFLFWTNTVAEYQRKVRNIKPIKFS